MTTPPEHMRLLIALLEAPKPTRNELLVRQRDAFLRKNKIDLGPNFSALEADTNYADPANICIYLEWHSQAEYNQRLISIRLRKSAQSSNTAQIRLLPPFANEPYAEWLRLWRNASPAERDKIAQDICGNVGIVPGSIAGTVKSDYFPFDIVPGSTLANMTKLIPDTEQQANELESIFNKG